ncbi:MAG TPA: hypothetical protein VFW69_22800 [Mycobacterium sp.]|nr:hypothetical protein [Mycobacterium sp.]
MRSRRALIAVIAASAVFMVFIAAAPPKGYDGPPLFVANPVSLTTTVGQSVRTSTVLVVAAAESEN